MGKKRFKRIYLSFHSILGFNRALSQAEGIRFYHGDHVGSSTVVTEEQGEVVETIHYTPFGESFSPHPLRAYRPLGPEANPLPFGERAQG